MWKLREVSKRQSSNRAGDPYDGIYCSLIATLSTMWRSTEAPRNDQDSPAYARV
jgi:hypothetical protein